MASDPITQKLMYKIARAYYDERCTQQEIGERFGLSRVKVGRLLEKARRENIVKISFLEPKDNTYLEIENQIEKKYQIDEVLLVPARDDHKRTLRGIGQMTADYLERIITGNEVIGLTWGNTLLCVVNALHANNWPGVKVVQLLGGLGSPEADMYGTDLTIRTAQTLGAKARLLSAPGIVSTKTICDALLKNQQIDETLKLGEQSDIALVGLGRPSSSSPVMQAGFLTPKELKQLDQQGAVGDIGLNFIDAKGELIENEINDRVIGLKLKDFRKIKRFVAIAAGADKFEVVRAALAGKYIKVLITDVNIGMRLLD